MDHSNRDALVLRLMQHVRLLQGFARPEVEELLHHTVKREAKPNEAVMNEGEPGHTLYIILSGEVEVTAKTSDGECRLAKLGPGDTFGELCLLESWPRSATVRALSHVLLLEFARRDMLMIPTLLPKLYRNVAYLLGSRLRNTNSVVSLIIDEHHAEKQQEPPDTHQPSAPGIPAPSETRVVRR